MGTLLSENLRRVMFEKRMNGVALAEVSSVPSARIYDIVNSKVPNPRINTVVKLAKGLDVSVDVLTGINEVVDG